MMANWIEALLILSIISASIMLLAISTASPGKLLEYAKNHFRKAVELIPRNTTTTTTSTSTTTTTITSTTSTSTTTVTTTTVTTTSMTTTMSGRRCDSDEDCGGVVSTFICRKNSIWNYTTTYRCENRGTPTSRCVGKIRQEVVDKCETYEDCVKGECVRIYENECDYECNQRGYDGHYCKEGGCPQGDHQLNLDDDCSTYRRICCCTS
ncbi:MAG: hypothetical protein ABIH11_04730 [Candidatus Altiarchaeota archaeon]